MLDEGFYARDAETVARDLLGATLNISGVSGVQRVRIVETEAYLGPHDLAAHTARGRTKRTEVMFGPPGRAYVYLIYGMYDMLNIVTGQRDGQAVLIRAAEPLDNVLGNTDGPGKLTRALGISKARHNGLALFGPELWLEAGAPPRALRVTPRVGIDYAGSWKDAPLRFLDADSAFVSRP